jgi:hypothetical protein
MHEPETKIEMEAEILFNEPSQQTKYMKTYA